VIWQSDTLYLCQVQSFLTALRALSHKDFHYGSYATSEQVANVFFTSSIVRKHKLMKSSEICIPHLIFQHTSLCSVLRWLLLEICVRYAKKRCMFPSFCAANTSFVKIVYPNGNSQIPPPVVLPCDLSFALFSHIFQRFHYEYLLSWHCLDHGRFERERTCPLCRALVKPADLRSFGDGSTSLFFQLF
jgi:hypothetical protein